LGKGGSEVRRGAGRGRENHRFANKKYLDY